MPATNFNILTGLNVGNVTTDAAANSVATSGNITAGNLASTGLTSTASFTVSGTSNLGAVGNVTITGGAANQVLITNGSGVLSFTNVNALVGTISSAVANQVTYYTAANTLSGSSNLTWNGADLLTVTGNVSASNFSTTGTLNVSGNANVGNLGATNANLSAATVTGNLATGNTSATLFTGNITGTSGVFSGNVTFGNINAVSGILGVSGNITGGNLITTGFLNVSGNANVGNIGAAAGVFTGNVSVTSNISAGNINSVSGILNVTGNANVGNIGATRGVFTNISGTIESGSASQTNITSVGTLTALTVSGNAFLATSSGNVGIGTSSPAAPLHVQSSTTAGAPALIIAGESNAERFQIRSSAVSGGTPVVLLAGSRGTQASPTATQSGDVLGYYQFGGHNGTSYFRSAWIYGLAAENYTAIANGSHIVLSTTANGSTSPTEKMRIDSNGNVGIGNTSPTNTLSVTGTLNVSGNANVGNLGTAGNITASYFFGNGSQLTGVTAVAAPSTSVVNGTSNLVVAANGNVTTSVAGTANVLVVTSTGANVTGTFNATGNANVGNIGATNIVGTLSTAAQTNITSLGTLSALTVSGNTFLATSSGNVGIGTSSPRAILNTNVGTITAPAVTPGLMLTSVYSGVTSVNSIDWNYSGQTTSPVRLGATFNSDGAGMEMAFYTSTSYTANGSERVRINKDGNVGIGNTAPTNTLSVTGTMNLSGNANVGNIGATRGVFTNISGTIESGSASQTNITAVGTLTALTVSGNITGQANVLVTSNITAGNINSVSGILSVTGNANVGNIGATNGVFTNVSGSGAAMTSLPAGNLTGTIPSGVLGNSSLFVGTTSIALNRSSANLALTGITSIAMPGSTSGTVTLQPAATAGTTTITLPATTGTVVTTGDSGTVTSTMIADATIVNADISASAAIAVSKLAASTISGITLGNNLNTLTMNVSGTGLSGSTTYNGSAAATFTVTSNATSANTVSAIVARDASGNFSAGTITATLTGSASLFNNVSATTRSSAHRSNRNLSGGGTITVDASGNVLWSSRFIVISNGRGSNFAVSGYWDITCPTSGTITGVGGAANKTATAAGIPLAAWDALYYILPIGSTNVTVAANFRVSSYTSDVDVPHDWVLICIRNGDDNTTNFNNGIVLGLNQSMSSVQQSSANTANTLVRRDGSGNFSAGTITATTFSGSGASLTNIPNSATTATTANTGSTIVSRDANGDFNARYINVSYFNSTDDISTGTLTYLMGKFGDNYLRSATAAKVATFISGQSMNISGNATNLSTTRSNWSTNGTITAVVGQLAWKNYGNNHTIFDASNSTAPDGSAVNNTNSQIAWTGSYPTLMGWNGANTYGVRVDSARVANNISDYTINQSVGTANAPTFAGLTATGRISAQSSQSSSTTVATATGSLGGIEMYGGGGSNAAFMAFHRPGAFAAYFGLDSDNNFAVGGWSYGAALGSMKVGSFGVGTAASGTAGEIRATNNITAYYSDQRLKENIRLITNPLEKVSKISGVTFTQNSLAETFGYTDYSQQVGVIAQEIQAVLPEAVTAAPFDIAADGTSKSGENYLTVRYEKLVPLLIEAIKELSAKVKELENK